MTMGRTLSIGTRKSPLALWQAEHVKALLEKQVPGLTCSLVRIVTKGDKILDVPLAQVGGKGLFVNEIENAMLRGEIDLAVHSMKDLPAELPTGLVLGAIPPREDPRDVLLFNKEGITLKDLPPGSRIGTSSLRRASQLRCFRRDLVMAPVRGNVGTRIRRLEEGRYDAIVLALAGLKRLGRAQRADEILDPEICLPAIGQGALAIEARESDEELLSVLQGLHDPDTAVAIEGERSFLETVEGSCQIPIGCYGRLSGGILVLTGLIATLDGSTRIRRNLEGPAEEAASLGRRLAQEILAAGGREILAEVMATAGPGSVDKVL